VARRARIRHDGRRHGIWSGTATALAVGFLYYSLQIDGAVIVNPSPHTYFGSIEHTYRVRSGKENR
jgi:hypothetical protein